MEDLTRRMQEEEFDVTTQYCDPDDCLRDCIHPGVNNCDAVALGIW